MTPPPGTIGRARLKDPGADFAALRAEAIHSVQVMSGTVWTDYNFSDPGVTIIEQLCYALTEMPYRARFPVADLLCDPRTRKLELRRQGLFPAPAILPCNPVTANDFRRLILDRVPGIANVWFTPTVDRAACPISGLYDVTILPDPSSDRDEQTLINRVRRCYTAHRALCEDIASVHILDPIRTIVEARIEIDKHADPSDTLADALFALGLTLAPEPSRVSFDEKTTADPASSDIFHGPLMLRGFIADDQLKPRPGPFVADQLAEVLAGVDGVLTVDRLAVHVGDHRHACTGTTPIPVPENSFLHLQTKPHHGRFAIRMTCNQARCEPDAGRVRRRLAQRWRQQRQTYPLRQAYAEHYGTPKSTYWDLDTYTSIQNQFPRLYGIGAGALPATPSPTRLAQIKQLKGYLLPFDQLLADSYAQLGFLNALFSIEAGGDATYRWQSLRGIVPDIERMGLLATGYDAGMDEIVAETDPVLPRRNAVLDLLLSFYALRLAPPDGAPADVLATLAQSQQMIAAKQTLLRRAALATRGRGRGADYRRPFSSRSAAGAELISAIELGLLDEEASDRGEPEKPVPRPPDDPRNMDFGRLLPPELSTAVARFFRGIDLDDDRSEGEPPPSLLAGRPVPRALLDGLLDPDAFRLGSSDGSEMTVLVCRDANDRWWLIAEFESEGEARRAARALRHEARHRRHARERSLYLVDWILLRHAGIPDDANGCRYNFRVSAVLDTTRDERDAPGWEAQATAILRENIPAHVALDCLFLDDRAMGRFDALHTDWTHALRHGPRSTLAEASRRLEHFLIRHDPASGGGDQGDTSSQEPPPTPPAEPAQEPAPPVDPASPTEQPLPTEPSASAGPAITPPAASPAPPPPAEAPPPEEEEQGRSFWSWLWWLLTLVLRVFLWWRRPASALIPDPQQDALSPPSQPSTPPSSNDTPDPTKDAPSPTAAAPAGAIGFDTATSLTASAAAAFRASGFQFAIRYLSRSTPQASGDLSASEAAAIRSAGLALMAVQHVSPQGWVPTAPRGTQYGDAAVANAQSIGLPAGLSIWLDLEGIATGTASGDIIAYCNAWIAPVAQAGYRAGIYVGASCGLTADQLGTQLQCSVFWKSGSTVPTPSGFGFCMIQTINSSYVVNGVAYDRDVVQADEHGATPYWWVAAESGSA